MAQPSRAGDPSPPLLAIRGLTVAFPSPEGWVEVVREASLTVAEGEVVGLVGESGSGKTMTALAVLRLVPPPGRIVAGSVRLAGDEVLELGEPELRRMRGGRVGMVFQEPAAALDPVFTVGSQLVEAIRAHEPLPRREARARAAELLARVAIPDPRRRLDAYPHELSGGQRQRVMIALALAASPSLLLADEPTTALDVTLQAQMLELLLSLRDELGLAILLVTHDLAVVAETCDRVVVMYCGEVVEEAPTEALFAAPAHPYTQGLIAAVPRLGSPAPRGAMPTIPGQVPDPRRRPPGCAFHPRCSYAMAVCAQRRPELYALPGGVEARCLLHDEALR
jgi:peptide/nickel transport system ATP-binding protein/oligopeptide transport system ATP-binding protein